MKLNGTSGISFAAALFALTVFAADAPTKVEWKTLRGLNYKTGEQTPEIKKINQASVRIPGFMVPLEDDDQSVTEFLLVPYVGACIHTPPPPPNQIVHVKMQSGKKVKLNLWDPVWAVGKLQVSTVQSPYGDVSFTLSSTGLEPYKEQ